MLSTLIALATVPFWVTDGLYGPDQNDLGLSRPEGLETVTVFAPTASTDQFSNGVCMVGFKDGLYCMWQSSHTDEDASETWVAYARSLDGGATVACADTLATGLAAHANVHHTFSNTINMHAGDDTTFNIKVWVEAVSSDPNRFNDTSSAQFFSSVW